MLENSNNFALSMRVPVPVTDASKVFIVKNPRIVDRRLICSDFELMSRNLVFLKEQIDQLIQDVIQDEGWAGPACFDIALPVPYLICSEVDAFKKCWPLNIVYEILDELRSTIRSYQDE